MCRWPLRAPTPLLSILWPIIEPIKVTFGQICNFRNPYLVTFYFYELTLFFDWMEDTLLHLQYNILVRLLTVNMKNCLNPKTPKMCDPIVVTLLKMRPHYSQSSRENATPIQRHIPISLLQGSTTPGESTQVHSRYSRLGQAWRTAEPVRQIQLAVTNCFRRRYWIRLGSSEARRLNWALVSKKERLIQWYVLGYKEILQPLGNILLILLTPLNVCQHFLFCLLLCLCSGITDVF